MQSALTFRVYQANLVCKIVLSLLCGFSSAWQVQAEVAADRVLVLYNADQGSTGAGYQIADYYRELHPGVHLLGVTGVEQALTGETLEMISADNYLAIMRPQILAGISALGDSVDVIVTTKGLPLKIDAGKKPSDNSTLLWRRFSSLESELTRIDTISSREMMGDQFIYTGFPDIDPQLSSNPYYNSSTPFVRTGSDPLNGDIRLAARLDGFDVTSVRAALDRAQRVFVVPGTSAIIADDDPTAGTDQMIEAMPGGPGPGLVDAVRQAGFIPIYENTDEPITHGENIVGYVSHGVNDGSGGLEDGYLTQELKLDLQPGAVFLTHESRNAASFSPDYSHSQGLIADWLEIGGTAGLGHIHEPQNGPDNVTNEDIFFANLLPAANSEPGTAGLTFVEAAWSATRQLSYVNTVVGDPLMTWRVWLPGDSNLDGKVEYQDFYRLQGNWQNSGSLAEGDFNADGNIDMLDFKIFFNNWLADIDLARLVGSAFEVVPEIDITTGMPTLAATLHSPANLDGDLDVDAEDLSQILTAYGSGAMGDVDDDGETDGRDFLAWQREYREYKFTADFEIDAIVGAGDLRIWQSSYGVNRGGDTNGDYETDGRDFLAWQRECNASIVTGLPVASAVPEPTASWLIACSSLLAGLRRQRKLRSALSFAR